MHYEVLHPRDYLLVVKVELEHEVVEPYHQPYFEEDADEVPGETLDGSGKFIVLARELSFEVNYLVVLRTLGVVQSVE